MEAASRSQTRTSAALSIALALAAGAGLRLWLYAGIDGVYGDSLVYGDIARNLLRLGRYALTESGAHETLIRLPGYPFLLAGLFRLFGVGNYAAAVWLQIPLDLASCLLLFFCARRLSAPSLAAHMTLWLAALCPLTAYYAGQPLTETPTLFFISLALWAVAHIVERPAWPPLLAFALAASGVSLLRPDGALLPIALAPPVLLALFGRRSPQRPPTHKALCWTLLCLLLALSPFALWTWRNWRVFHVFQPLAPRSATDPREPTYPGWERWVRTWSLDFASTYDIYWNVPNGEFDLNLLPARAIESPRERAELESLSTAYKANHKRLSHAMDERFARLAEERVAAHPLRYALWLPLGRLADMWLRPRNEALDVDVDWWRYRRHPDETRLAWALIAINLFYLGLGAAGLWMRPRLWQWMLLYMALRSALLLTVQAPEARYTIECFPMLFLLGGLALYRLTYTVLPSTGRVKASLARP